MQSEPPPPPFREHEFGAGLEIEQAGSLVTLRDEDGQSVGRIRVSNFSLRTQNASAAPLGRVKIAKDQWTFITRSGEVLCSTPANHDAELQISCQNGHSWEVETTPTSIVLKHHADNEENEQQSFNLNPNAPEVRRAGKSWSVHARTLLAEAFETPNDDPHRFAAVILASWMLKHQAVEEQPAAHETSAAQSDQEPNSEQDAEENAAQNAQSEAEEAQPSDAN